MSPRRLVATSIALCGCLFGCEEDELNFSTREMEVFTGEVVDAEFVREQPRDADHILAAGTTMELNLAMRRLDTDPGSVSTSDGLFDDVSLVTLPEITCDSLSALEIPGNFLRSFIFLAPTSAPELEGADGVLFVSLAHNDRIDVRVLVGSGEGSRAFGVFHLDRERIEDEETVE